MSSTTPSPDTDHQRTDEAVDGASRRPATVLAAVREQPRYRWPAVALGAVIGIGLSTVHWSGIVVGGALVGVFAATLRRALLYGVCFGALVVAVWAVSLAVSVDFGRVAAMGELAGLPVGTAFVLAVLGSLLRGA